MLAGSSASTVGDDTVTTWHHSLTRRQFLWTGAMAAVSLLLPPSPVHAVSDRRLLPVPFHYQRHTLTCEIAALRMAAEYHGQIWTEESLLTFVPIDERQPRHEGDSVVWADPNLTFPGNIGGWQLYRGGLQEHPERAKRGQWGYGLHAPVIADLATRMGLAAELFDQVEAVYAGLDRGHVPIVIVPDAGRDQAIKWQWHSPQGTPVTVMNAEHAVTVRGYDSQRVWVNDPKGKVWSYPRDRFERAFALLSSGVTIGPERRFIFDQFKPI
ncbi:MAG: C39 family peptidase [Anaerolineae bacterium]|nr:C39 family peptidase [Anaerolineae bacterium]